MDRLRIDRLSLHVPDLSEANAARLARLVAEKLGAIDLPAGAGSPAALRVDLRARAADSIDSLAARIVAEIARQLVRSSGRVG